jgi:hypothetical protein
MAPGAGAITADEKKIRKCEAIGGCRTEKADIAVAL